MDFKSKSDDVLAQGAAERNSFTPHGAPLRSYQYWANNGGNAPERENFCHYWRVVLIWSPLRRIYNAMGAMEGFLVTASALIFAASIALAVLFDPGFFALTALLTFVWVLCGFIVASYYNSDDESYDSLNESARTERVLYKIFNKPQRFLSWISQPLRRPAHWLGEHIEQIFLGVAGLCGLLIVAVVVTGIIEAIGNIGWLATLAWAGGIVGALAIFLAVVIGLNVLGDRIREKRLHEMAEMRAKYYDGEITAEEYANYRDDEPGKVKRFFRGVKEFAVLIANVIRTKKWKICPIVDIDKSLDA